MKYRPDIDGLRAIAVSLVVVFHAAPDFLRGGFVGVDVFFVISGYLITSIIHAELSAGAFSLVGFYSKRILRIYPALILVLIVCLVLGYFVLLSREYASLGKHVAAGAAYVSNFVLMKESGYFDTQAVNKPLLHLWSLAIEEQFYLIWPTVLMMAMAKKGRLLIILTLIALVSFCLCVGYTARLPDVVFYTSLTRSWELLIGAGLVLANPQSLQLASKWIFEKIGAPILSTQVYSQLLSFAGFAAICFSSIYFDHTDRFPYWRALVPCIGAALIIASGPFVFVNRFLASKPLVFIGLVSYPLYLWHWPVLFYVRALTNNRDSFFSITFALLVSVVAAIATYGLVEIKVRRSSAKKTLSLALFGALVFVGLLGFAVYQKEGFPTRYPQQEQQARNVDSFTWNEEGYNSSAGCIVKLGEKFKQYCNLMNLDLPPTAVLIGDSTANHFYYGLSVALSEKGGADNLLQIGKGGCPPLIGVEAVRKEGGLHCNESTSDMLDYISDHLSIDTVILTMTGATYMAETFSAVKRGDSYQRLRSIDDPLINDPGLILEAGLRLTLSKLLSMNRHVIVLMSAPALTFNPSECLSIRPYALMGPKRESCDISQEDIADLNGVYRTLIAKISRDFPGVEIWDPYDFVCNTSTCNSVVDGVPLYRDSLHLSIYGSHYLGRKLLQKYSLR
ncbi:acyltransferase family protein [Rhodoferax bucti]|uniref:acyltransferase family protein n=1 Tax=Rhodoferax bucti TaxID=2576305 RepID=UPI001476FF26|nr:acyltransferase family protein [Rhodoferax bucti]